MLLREGWRGIRRRHVQDKKRALENAMAAAPELDARQVIWRTKMGAWINVLPSMVNVTDIGAQEWRGSLFIHYGIDPPDLPIHCDGCNAKFSICHALDFKKSSLITTCHNKLRDGVTGLAGKSFTPSHMRRDPLIHQVHYVREGKAHPVVYLTNNPPETTENSK